jgi:hypothetical protein
MRCLDPLKDGESELLTVSPQVGVEELELKGPEEALRDRVIKAVADRSHRSEQAGGAEATPERPRRVLRAVIGVRHGAPSGRLASPRGHLQGVDDELGSHVVGDRPPHHHPAEPIENHRQVHRAVTGGMLGDVHHPQPVRFGRVEGPVHQVIGGRGGRVPASAAPPAAAMDALDAGLAHQPFHSFAAAADALAQAQLGVHPG